MALQPARRAAIESVLGQEDQFRGIRHTQAHGTSFVDDDGTSCYIKVVKCNGTPILNRALGYYGVLLQIPQDTQGLLLPTAFGVVPEEMISPDESGQRAPTYYVVSPCLDGTLDDNSNLSRADLATLKAQIRSGLHALFASQLMHRDIQFKNFGYFNNSDGTRRYVLFDFEEAASTYDPNPENFSRIDATNLDLFFD